MLESNRQDRYTYGDYLVWSGDERWELIDGEPWSMSPAPSAAHQRVLLGLATQVVEQLRGHECEAFIAPFDVRLPAGEEADDKIKTVVQPDLTVVCDPSKIDEAGCRGTPDWIVEVLSPQTALHDRRTKRDVYERAGAREYWMVDPRERSLTVLNREAGRWKETQNGPATGTTASSSVDGVVVDWERVFEAL